MTRLQVMLSMESGTMHVRGSTFLQSTIFNFWFSMFSKPRRLWSSNMYCESPKNHKIAVCGLPEMGEKSFV